jgi:hypothetical protein
VPARDSCSSTPTRGQETGRESVAHRPRRDKLSRDHDRPFRGERLHSIRVLASVGAGGRVDKQELVGKLKQIEEQASDILAEFPKNLTRERLRMIIALARYLRIEIDLKGGLYPFEDEKTPVVDPQGTLTNSSR